MDILNAKEKGTEGDKQAVISICKNVRVLFIYLFFKMV